MATSAWHCRRCRLRVCDEGDLDVHQREENGSIRRNPWNTDAAARSCTSLFLSEPMAWMDALNDAQGQILCPNKKCAAKLGAWNWHGSQCSCGAWVTPSISLVSSKLDRKPMDAAKLVVVEPSINDSDSASAAATATLRTLDFVDRSAAFAVPTTEQPKAGDASSPPEPPNPAALAKEAAAAAAAEEAAMVAAERGTGRSSCSIHWFVTAPPPAVVIFLHDEGESRGAAKAWVDDKWGGRLMGETRAAFLFPDSGISPRTGRRVWFDTRAAIAEAEGVGALYARGVVGGGTVSIQDTETSPEGFVAGRFSEASPLHDVRLGLAAELRAVVRAVVRQGTPARHVFLGGLGHGGTAALVAGLRLHLAASPAEPGVTLGGIFCFGGGLDPASALFAELRQHRLDQASAVAQAAVPSWMAPAVSAVVPPSSAKVLICHGRDDPAASLPSVNAAANSLRTLLRPCAPAAEVPPAAGVTAGAASADDDDGDSFGPVQLCTFQGARAADGGVRTLATWMATCLAEPRA